MSGLTLVRQDDPWGCMIAAVAMVMGRTYAEVKAMVHPWHLGGDGRTPGIGMGEADGLLAEHGYAVARRFQHYHATACHRAAWPPAPWADVHLCEVVTGGPHAVVMLRDGTVLDPWYGEVPEGLARYSRVMWVAAVHRVADSPIRESITSPDSPDRRVPTVCMCRDAWHDAEGTP